MRSVSALLLSIALSFTTLTIQAQYLGGPGDGHTDGCTIPPNERAALEQIFTDLNGASWINATNWNTSADPITWYGVVVEGCHVVELNLAENNLVGDMPAQLADLTMLRKIDLRSNIIYGFPGEWANLNKLRYIDLRSNSISSALPLDWSNLPLLTELRLSGNFMTGGIPPGIAALTFLEVLDLGDNQLGGSIPPELESLGIAGILKELNFENNQLTGNIPAELWRLGLLEKMNLRDNLLTGSIPPEFGGLFSLVEMDFSNNQLDGSIPPELGSLDNLELLGLNDNHLSGSLPPELGDLGNLTELDLGSNELTGSIPEEIATLGNLVELDLSNNHFTGTPPSTMVSMTGDGGDLEYIDFSHNHFTGMIDFEGDNYEIDFSYNNLDFEDIEPIMAAAANPLQHTYAPQQDLPPGGIATFVVGGDIDIPFTTGGTSNMYQWYMGSTPISSETLAALSIGDAQASDAGIYRLRITNTVATDLELWTEPYIVSADLCDGVLRTSGMIDETFDPGIESADSGPFVVMQGTKILTSFINNNVGATLVDGIHRFLPNGTLDAGFQIPGVYPGREQFIVRPDNSILIGENNGTYAYVARYSSEGVRDFSLASSPHQWYDGGVRSMAVQSSGRILVSHNASGTEEYVDRIKPNGDPDETYTTFDDFQTNVMRVRADDQVLVGGFSVTSNGLEPAIYLLEIDGGISSSSFFGYMSDPEGEIHDIAIQPDGKVIVAGRFRTFNDVSALSIVRLHPDGSIDEGFQALGLTEDFSLNRIISKVELQADGKIIIAGRFISINGSQRVSVARLNSDGTLDCEFDPGVGPGAGYQLNDIAIQPDKKILLSGFFFDYEGEERNGLVRIAGEEPDGLSITLQPTNATVCENGTAVFTSAASGDPDIDYQWQFSTNGAPPFLNITGATTGTLTVSPVLAANAGFYRCRFAAETFPNIFSDVVTLTINTPTPPGGTEVHSCDAGVFALTATGGSAGVLYQWYTVPTGGSAIAGETAATYTTPPLSANTTYYVSLEAGSCESARTAIDAIIDERPPTPVGTDGFSCGPGIVVLNASAASSGYHWYTALTGGTAIATNVTGSFTTPSLSTTTTYYVSSDNEACESATRTQVTATISTIPPAPGVTGASSCAPGSLVLQATGGAAGEYRWYTSSTGPSLISGEVNDTYTTPAITTTTTYYATLHNGLCESTSRVAVTATINTPASPPGVTAGSRCGPSTVSLSASGTVDGQYRWYSVPTGGTPIAGEVNSSFTTPSISASQTYYVSIDGVCESARTAVVATVDAIPTSPTVTDGSRCGAGTVVVSAGGSTDGNFRWYSVPTGGTSIAGEVNSSFTTPSFSSTQTYYVSINTGCESARTAVVASVGASAPTPTVAGASRCGAGTVVLSATGSADGNYRWYTVPTGGTPVSGEVNSSFTTPAISSTQTFYVSINIGCESPRIAVVASINAVLPPPTTTGASRCDPGTVTLSANGGTNGNYRWYSVSTGGTPITGEVNATFTTPSLTSTQTYHVSIDDGCETTRTAVTATVNSTPSSPTAAGASRCGPGTVNLTASGGSNGNYRWYTTASGGMAIAGEVNSSFTTPAIAVTTTYFVAVDGGGCESARVAVVATINTIPTAPATTGAAALAPASVILTALGGLPGQYRWYTAATGGSPIAGEVNATYATPVLSTITTYFVSINDGTCESSRTPVLAALAANSAPVIQRTTAETDVKSVVTVPLAALISDADNNLDFTTLQIIEQPVSGATASIDAQFNLILNYGNVNFAGTDRMSIRICDVIGACTTQELEVEVMSDLVVFNAISPNGDDKNPILYIQYIDILPKTIKNKVMVFNRWGDPVFEVSNYDNVNRVFRGLGKDGEPLPSGTYYYKIDFEDESVPSKTGYIQINH